MTSTEYSKAEPTPVPKASTSCSWDIVLLFSGGGGFLGRRTLLGGLEFETKTVLTRLRGEVLVPRMDEAGLEGRGPCVIERVIGLLDSNTSSHVLSSSSSEMICCYITILN